MLYDYGAAQRADVGSSSRWNTKSHLLYSLIYDLGADAFSYTVIHPGTNFLRFFNEAYPNYELSIKDLQLLDAFTKYELALVEQSYLDLFKPTLNGRHIATTSTHPHLLTPIMDSNSITSQVTPLLRAALLRTVGA